MEKKTFIDKVKALFSEVEQSESNVEVQFIEYVAEDGSVLKISETDVLEAGVAVVMVTPEGEEVPVPAGSYVLVEEGVTVTVDENSVIVEVAEIQVEEAPVDAPVPAEAEMSAEEVEEVEQLEEVEEEIEDAMEARIAALETAIANMAETMSAIDVLSEKLDKISGEPADEEIKLSKVESNKKEKIEDKLTDLARFRKK